MVRELSRNWFPILHREPVHSYLCSLLLMGTMLAVNFFTLEVRQDCSIPLPFGGRVGGTTYDLLVQPLKHPLPLNILSVSLRVVNQFSANYSSVFLVFTIVFHFFSISVASSKHPVLPSVIHFKETSIHWLPPSPGGS